MIYLDYNATTPIAPEVVAAMLPYLEEEFGNPSSGYPRGWRALEAVVQARRQVAATLGCTPEEVVFVSGATEANNTVLKGVAEHFRAGQIITTAIEHPAVLAVCRELENHGYTVVELNVDKQGRLDLAELEGHLDENTALVTIMYANNETGVIFPIEQM